MNRQGGSRTFEGDNFTVGVAGGRAGAVGEGGAAGAAGRVVAVQGPGGNTAVRGRGVAGATNGEQSVARAGSVRGVQGEAGAAGVRRGAVAASDGTNTVGRAGSVRAATGAGGTVAVGRGVATRNGQVVASRQVAAVRGNFTGYGNYFNSGWYARYPGAWFAAGMAAGVWGAATWGSVSGWCGYGESAPISYDYGENITYEGDVVYVDGEPTQSADQYYEGVRDIAEATPVEEPPDTEWMPLGVFGLVSAGAESTEKLFQIAVDKQGNIRGNYHDIAKDLTQPIRGQVDKETRRAAWRIGDNESIVVETGIFNLTNDEVPVLVHFGPDRREEWKMIRLEKPPAEAAAAGAASN